MTSHRAMSLVLMGLLTLSSGSLIAALGVGVHPFAESRDGISAAARLCERLLLPKTGQALLATSLITALLAKLVITGLNCMVSGHRKLRRATLLLSLSAVPLTRRLSNTAERLGIRDRLVVIDSAEPFAFTCGLLRPRIYVSTVTVHRLSREELEVVLWHEKRHAEARDPLRFQALGAFRAAFGYLPVVGRLTTEFTRHREYAADDAALAKTANPRALIGALVKLGLPEAAKLDLSAPGYSGFAVQRIARLVPPTEPGVKEGWAPAAAAAVTTAAFLLALPVLSLLLTEANHLISICAM